jgi:hypothetical protein
MKRIYVAGPITDKDPVKLFNNIRQGISISAEILSYGFAPFCPFLDYQYCFHNKDIDVGKPKAVSIEWLKSCDAVFLLPGWEKSKGTLAEVKIAKYEKIPIFEHWQDLLDFKYGKGA